MTLFKKIQQQFFSFGKRHSHPLPATEDTDSFALDDNFNFANIPDCPACGSDNVAIFAYGKPRLSKIIIEGFESGKIIPGGCMILKTTPKWHCYNCNRDFGRLL
ncbi:MAG: hypothetical protein U9Q61_08660 [Thermodesulfobacteriota bacterium]|nr:hypothetical protein [Thermodesulfobacteriota bacterium]